jgi:hypothetical protein
MDMDRNGNRVQRFRIRRCRLLLVDLLDSSKGHRNNSSLKPSRREHHQRGGSRHHLLDVDPSPETMTVSTTLGPFVLRMAGFLADSTCFLIV